jgi:hypothetical protein
VVAPFISKAVLGETPSLPEDFAPGFIIDPHHVEWRIAHQGDGPLDFVASTVSR